MTRLIRLLACLATLSCLLAAGLHPTDARAQMPGRAQGGGGGLSLPPPLPDPMTGAARLGTRLEPGAVLCRTREGLSQWQTALAAQNAGTDGPAALPAGCVLVGARTPVRVMERRGLGLTMVKITSGAEETGWTDAYLPDRRN